MRYLLHTAIALLHFRTIALLVRYVGGKYRYGDIISVLPGRATCIRAGSDSSSSSRFIALRVLLHDEEELRAGVPDGYS
jgi:hypothetical protein